MTAAGFTGFTDPSDAPGADERSALREQSAANAAATELPMDTQIVPAWMTAAGFTERPCYIADQ